jgi:hypothetical protein
MDWGQIATQAAAILAPLMPYLIKAGEKAAEEAGKQIGGNVWDKAKSMWGRLAPKVEAKPAALEAAQDVAGSPDDKEAHEALRYQLKKIFAEDESFGREIAQLLEEIKSAGGGVMVKGDRNVAIGGSVSGSTIITGDDNKIER